MVYVSNMANDLQFNTENFPVIIQNDGSVTTLVEAKYWIATHLAVLKKELAASGALLFRGFPVVDPQSYDNFFSSFGYGNFTYKESLSNAVRINHTERVFTANEAPKNVEIFLHNEMAQTPIFPNIISLFCQSAAEQGGETTICRSDVIYNKLHAVAPEATDKLEALGIRYTTIMPGENSPESGQGRSWKSTLSADNKDQAEARLKQLGYQWQWNEDGSLSAQTPVLQAIKSLADGRKVFFNQIIAAYMGWKGVKEDPSRALCFGDGSAFDKAFLDQVVAIAKVSSYDIPWQDGDVAVVDNHMVMHGRLPYAGERVRKVFVVLGI